MVRFRLSDIRVRVIGIDMELVIGIEIELI